MAEQNGPAKSCTVDVVMGTGTADDPNRYYPLVKIKDILVTTAGEDTLNDVLKVETRGAFANISTATTTTVKAGSGHVNSVRVLGGTLGNVTIYDNTAASGTVIVPTVLPIAGLTLIEHIEFSVGLTIVTAAATVIAISYR